MAKKKIPQLKIETVPTGGHFLYLSLIEYKREEYLCVIDKITPAEIGAFVIDFAEQEGSSLPSLFQLITKWFYASSDSVPLSIEFSRLGLTEKMQPIYRTFDTAYVSRVIGNVFCPREDGPVKVKRRRLIPVPEAVEIRLKKS